MLKEAPEKTRFFADEAITYLRENGYSTTKGSLYQLTSKGLIEYGRSGLKKLLFSKTQLDTFLERQLAN